MTEQGIAGFGIGLASMGHMAIAEIQFADYIFPAFGQARLISSLVNEAAKFRYRSGGHFSIGGLTVRTPTMAVGHGGLYHSQSPEGFFMGASGLKVVIPCSPIQCKGLLSAIRDSNQFYSWSPKSSAVLQSNKSRSTTSHFALPLSSVEILIPGSDLTLLIWGTPIYHCEAALHLLDSPPPSLAPLTPPSLRSAKIELIDLRTILPWDIETVVESVHRTKRLVIVHEAGMMGGVRGEIAAEVGKRAFLRLEAPVRRITGWDVPAALQFETFNMPDEVRILDGIMEMLSY
ncbi:thiamine diphosphate-binding protein [Suillus lakei]|nr:thiamine diphosphate-binding protein [Suillus lakei]